MARKAGLVFVLIWGVSQFTSMLEFAKRLLKGTENRFSITVLVVYPPPPGSTSSTHSYVQSIASSGLDIHFEEIPPGPPSFVRRPGPEGMAACFVKSHESLKAAISQRMSSPTSVSAVVFDVFAASVLDITCELNIPAYVFFSSTALWLALMLLLPTLHGKISVEFEDMEGEVEVPGASPIPPLCLPGHLLDKKSEGYSCLVEHGRRFLEAKGIIINSFLELQPGPLRAIQEGLCVPDRDIPTPPIYPVGPIIALQNDIEKASIEQNECILWLNRQPPASVVFLCFGSVRGLNTPTMQQMAIGLERSGVRFLWSTLRAPPTGSASLEELFPEGFMERTKGKGLVWPGWVPQKDILAHAAVGAFVTHCGWNSVMESLWFGVPMIGWPLYAEQHLNAFELAREMGVSVELKMDRRSGNFVEAVEFERGLRCLMEDTEDGRKVRGKVEEMKLASRKALQEGGSSLAAFQLLAEELSRGNSESD